MERRAELQEGHGIRVRSGISSPQLLAHCFSEHVKPKFAQQSVDLEAGVLVIVHSTASKRTASKLS